MPFFGFNSILQEDLISNTTSTARKLLILTEGQLVLIFDRTYIEHQNSENNEHQKKLYYILVKRKHICVKRLQFTLLTDLLLTLLDLFMVRNMMPQL